MTGRIALKSCRLPPTFDRLTVMQTESGDRTERWRESYSRVRKDFLANPQSTNLKRLRLLGVDRLPRTARLLDVGAGDGNLCRTLSEMGFSQVWGLEYQAELLALHPQRERVVAASAIHLPYRTGSMSAVIVMDVLHHLTPAQLPCCYAEIRRVLKDGAALYLCEPAGTFFRKALTVLLMSPLSSVSTFARDKRAMVAAERDTLAPWLASERAVADRIVSHGFRLEFFRRCWLHSYGRLRAV